MKTFNGSRLLVIGSFCLLAILCTNCSKKNIPDNGGNPPVTPPSVKSDVDFYLTTGNQAALLQKQTTSLMFTSASNGYPDITVDTTQVFQTIDGFGFTLTDGSAQLISSLPSGMQNDLLKELFGFDSNSVSISYLRVSIGASDLSASVYTYDDMPAGQTDVTLSNFSLRKDKSEVVPILKKILAINPSIKILGSPWTAPTWMKTNNSSIGGSLLTQYYTAYANYFVNYISTLR